jgi:zinc finger FYVE domain-containing protein 1
VNARRVTERVVGTLAAVLDYPLSVIKDSARPAYWVPDEECDECGVCARAFDAGAGGAGAGGAGPAGPGPAGPVHHCRQCGGGVCDACSRTRMPAPLRGWDHPVRTCDACVRKINDANNV